VRGSIVLLLVVATVVVVGAFCVVILDQREIAFRTLLDRAEFEVGGVKLNEPILSEPGLYLSVPILHRVRRYDKRLLRFDARPQNAYTSQGDLILIDYYVIWRIEDPRRFYEAFPTDTWIENARNRIDNTTYNRLRNALAQQTIGDLLSDQREGIVRRITQAAADEMERQGIRIVDLQIRGLAYPEQNVEQVYKRMRSERERFALRARAEGEEESRAIRSKADEQVQITLAQALRDAERLRGEGDAEAARIYAEAFNRDPEFYAFVRSLEAYEKALDSQTTLILSPEVPFLKYLFQMMPPGGLPAVNAAPPSTP
jgi:membrane protease subunit HflC